MQKLNKDGSVGALTWQVADAETDLSHTPESYWLLPASRWRELEQHQASDKFGIVVTPEDDLESLQGIISSVAIVAVDFPAFTDGRGFSTARLIRQKLNYQGELIATGNFMQDQLNYLKRCGFDAFAIADDADIESMRLSLQDFSDSYQASADQPAPLFRRRHA